MSPLGAPARGGQTPLARYPARVLVAVVLVCVVVSSAAMGGGCGYRLGAERRLLRGVRTAHVAPVVVEAREAGAVPLFTAALREELAARARLRMASAAAADVLVESRLLAYDRSGFAFPNFVPGAPVRTGEFRASAKLLVEVRRRADNSVLWRSGELTATGEFLPGPDLMATEANRERALRQLATDLARKVAEQLADSF